MRRFRAALVAALVFAGNVAAQNYPIRPIRFIVPFPPGSGNDIMARVVGQKLTESSGGQVVIDNSALSMLPQVRTGKLRALAVTGARRLPALPDMPTVAESGVPGYEAASWYGVFAPAGTPRAIIDKVSGEVVRITRAPDVRERLIADGADPAGSSPEEFAAYIKRELARWGKVVREAGIKPQ